MELISLKMAVTLLIAHSLLVNLDKIAIDALLMNSNARTAYRLVVTICLYLGIFFALAYVWSLP